MRRKRIWFIAPFALLGLALFAWIGGEIVLHLWNWLMPMLFGLREVTFWQAVGILALSRILFGGLGIGGNRSRGRWDRHMSAEERARFRQRMRDRCGMGPETPETPPPTVS